MLTRRQRILLLAPFVAVVVPFFILPALCGFFGSFTNYAPFQADIRFVGLKNYVRILQDSSFQAAVWNVAVFTGVTVPLVAGVVDVCLFAPLFGGPLQGAKVRGN